MKSKMTKKQRRVAREKKQSKLDAELLAAELSPSGLSEKHLTRLKVTESGRLPDSVTKANPDNLIKLDKELLKRMIRTTGARSQDFGAFLLLEIMPLLLGLDRGSDFAMVAMKDGLNQEIEMSPDIASISSWIATLLAGLKIINSVDPSHFPAGSQRLLSRRLVIEGMRKFSDQFRITLPILKSKDLEQSSLVGKVVKKESGRTTVSVKRRR